MALLTGIVFGLAPALQTPASGASRRAEGQQPRFHRRPGGHWIRSALVVSEMAFACVLLVGAGLLIRSFLRVLDVNLGFRPERAATMRVDPDRSMTRRSSRTSTSTRCCAACGRFPES